jgi:signal transduction histidine kinase
VRMLEARAARTGVEIKVRTVPDEPGARAPTRVSPRSIAAMVRELLAHAISATPRGSGISVLVHAGGTEEGLGPRMIVDDGGTILPAQARRALLALEVEPGTFGRPSGVGLFLASEIASAQGALLEIGDAPVVDGRGGGVRVTVTFPH